MTFWRNWRGPILLITGVLICWQLLHWVVQWHVGDMAMRSPARTLQLTIDFLSRPNSWPHIQETLKAFAIALAIAVSSGVLIGLALGIGRFAGQIFEPMLVALYSIPKLTLYPIILLMFGLSINGKIAFGAIHGIIPIALFTINAVRNIRPILLKTGRVLNYTPMEMMWRILIPAALPEIFTGIRIGFALTLIGTILGEMFASQRGLGRLLMQAIGLHNIDTIMAVTFVVTVFAAIFSGTLLVIDRRLQRRAYAGASL